MPAKTFKMTAAGKAELEAELEQLKTEGRIDIAEKLKIARSYGDLSENSEYDEAKSEQAKIEARIQDLEYQLDHAVVVESTDKDTVSVGSTVTVIRKADNVGKGLIGAKIGETVTVEAPVGNIDFEIVDIQLN